MKLLSRSARFVLAGALAMTPPWPCWRRRPVAATATARTDPTNRGQAEALNEGDYKTA
jgi:hypothetical protein